MSKRTSIATDSRPTDAATAAADANRKAYAAPVLTELGRFGDLTRGMGGSNNDGVGAGGGMAGSFRT